MCCIQMSVWMCIPMIIHTQTRVGNSPSTLCHCFDAMSLTETKFHFVLAQ